MNICCTGIGPPVNEQKKMFLGDLIITEMHWPWVVPAYQPL